MKTLRIFISSPKDVAEERKKAKQVIADLQRRYEGQAELVPVLWEDLAIPATSPFQVGIDWVVGERHHIDVAVFILWSRLGSPIGPCIRKPDGSEYLSGTEREFDLMLAAFEESGRKTPIILAYTRRDDDGFNDHLDARQHDDDDLEEILRQRKLVKRFIIERFHDKDGHNLRAYHSYQEPVSFARRLRVHLQGAIEDLLEVEAAETAWSEPPYRSLKAFDIEHSPIFFGRGEETCDLLQRMRHQEAGGCSFVCVIGPSGSGKSSLVRAGVAATLLQNSYEDGVKEWRNAILLPARESEDLLGGLARLLAEEFPELRNGRGGFNRFAGALKDGNLDVAELLLEGALSATSKTLGGVRKALVTIDQMEELWSDRRITSEQRERFFEALEMLARFGTFSVLATLRSDFYQLAQQSDVFLRMKGSEGHFDLTPPGASSLRELILFPARRAGLRFERDERTGRTLDERILEDAAQDPTVLPLLQYALAELYDRREKASNLLTFEAYDAIGGVEGALERRAEETFAELDEISRDAFTVLLPKLIAVETTNDRGAVRRRAILSELNDAPERQRLIDALVRSRLLSVDAFEGTATASLAHDSLLRRWGRIRTWIDGNRGLLRLRSAVEQQQTMWEHSGCEPSRLLPSGLPLEEGKELLRNGGGLLGESTEQYIKLSEAHHSQEQLRARKRRRVVFTVMSALTAISVLAGSIAFRQRGQMAAVRDIQENLLWTASNSDHEIGLSAAEDGRVSDALLHFNRALEYRPTNSASLVASALNAYGRDAPVWRPRNTVAPGSSVLEFTFDENGRQVQVVCDDATIRGFDLENGREISRIKLKEPLLPELIGDDFPFIPGPEQFRKCAETNLKILNREDVKWMVQLEPDNPIESVDFGPDGKHVLIVKYGKGSPEIRDAHDGSVVRTFEGYDLGRFSPSGKYLGFRRDYSELVILDGQDFDGIKDLTLGSRISAFQFSPNEEFVAVSYADGWIAVFQLQGETEIKSVKCPGPGRDIVFSPDGTLFAVHGSDKIEIVRTRGAKFESTIPATFTTSVAFSPDGRSLALSDYAKGGRIVDPTSGRILAVLSEMNCGVIRFSPDGRFLVSQKEDGLLIFERKRKAEHLLRRAS